MELLYRDVFQCHGHGLWYCNSLHECVCMSRWVHMYVQVCVNEYAHAHEGQRSTSGAVHMFFDTMPPIGPELTKVGRAGCRVRPTDLSVSPESWVYKFMPLNLLFKNVVSEN